MRELLPLSRPPLNCGTCPIRAHTECYLLQTRQPATFAALARETLTVTAGNVILREGETPTKTFMLEDGWAFRFTLLPDGRRQILGFLLPGDMISLRSLLPLPMSFSVQALTDATLCSFDAAEFGAALKTSELCDHLIGKLMHHLTMADARISDLGQRTALERVARLIIDLEGRLRRRGLSHGDNVEFPLRQIHIGDALGLTTVHVSRIFSTLRDLGILTLRRQTIAVTDREKLLKIAGRTVSI